jgi:transposase
MSNTSLGVDVSKLELSIALLQDNKVTKTKFSNDTSGFKKLVQWLKKKKKVDNIKICMEATGPYSVGIANFLHGKGYSVYVVNPLCIKSFADSKLSRNKTDEGDAELIAKYILTNEARAYKPHSEIISKLRAFDASLESFKSARAQAKNHLSYVDHLPKELVKFWEDTVEHYDKQIDEMEKAMAKLIASDKDLQTDYDNLQTIPGIGKTSAMTILASIPDIAGFDDARQFAAYAGLTPRQTSSGTSVRGKTRLSKIGSSRLRKAMYFPGMAAKKFNPIVKAFCDNLIKKSKSPMVVLGAAMRKLMHIIFAILKHKCVFNPYSNAIKTAV